MGTFRTALLAVTFLLFSVQYGVSQDSETETSELAEKRFALFVEQAKAIELSAKDTPEKLQLREQPLQKFSTDGNTFGSVFLWKAEQGRPAAIGTIGALPINGVDFGFTEMHWLLDKPLNTVVIGKAFPKQWTATGNELVPVHISSAPQPAASAAARLTQMRSLARNFTVTMTENNKRHELRLLPQPLYRYDDPTAESDGAIFAYVWTVGTDPELLIHIQIRKQDGQLKWCYQPVRFTWRKLELSYEETNVWNAEELLSRNDLLQNGPYITTLTEAIR